MGLFGKKLKLEEEVAGNHAASPPDVAPPAPFELTTPVADPFVPKHTPAPIAAAPQVTAPVATGPRTPYTIDDAIKLMRSLPIERNADLVIRVMKQTLESLNVHIGDVLADADRKEREAGDQITAYRSDIAELESEIQIRRDEIRRLETELGEMSALKQRLGSNAALGATKDSKDSARIIALS